MANDKVEVPSKAFLEYRPRKREFVLRLYVDGQLVETIYWKKGARANGWPQWAKMYLMERGVYVG